MKRHLQMSLSEASGHEAWGSLVLSGAKRLLRMEWRQAERCQELGWVCFPKAHLR